MRRCILSPVIFFVFMIGLIGADFGQAAFAQTSHKETRHNDSRKKSHRRIVSPARHELSGKKAHSLRKKSKASADGAEGGKKARHARRKKHRHAHGSRTALQMENIPFPEDRLPVSHPSDLWLAKDMPDIYREYVPEDQLDEQSLKLLESAYSFIGTPYRWGGTTPDGFDCSGFIRYVFNENGIQLGRSSSMQVQEGKPVRLSDLKPGDLIFFRMHHRMRRHSRVNHVGMYVGNGQFIHASSNSQAHEIRVDELDSDRYFPRIVEARRMQENVQ